MIEKLNFPNVIIFNSSAGSGKTYNLALRYLQLLLTDFGENEVKNNINNILAITFTNKAAQEMRERIINWMKRIILDLKINDKDWYEVISEPLKTNEEIVKTLNKSKSEVQRKIEEIFNNLILNYSDFKVSTIDSFVSLVLKSSSFKLNISPDFEINTNISNYIDDIINEVFQEIIRDNKIREMFDRFIKDYIFVNNANVQWSPKNFIKNNIKTIWEKTQETGEDFKLNKRINSEAENIDLEEEIKNLINELNKKIFESDANINKKFKNALENSKEDVSKLKSWVEKNFVIGDLLNSDSKPVSSEIENLWNKIKKLSKEYFETLAVNKVSVVGEIYEHFLLKIKEELKRKKKIILINELNALLNEITSSDKEYIPEIYYYLSDRYFHFLIDEIQDTNYIQWTNLKKLVDEALSKGGSLFVVGDKKQSIYRWRGAHPQLIDEIENYYKEKCKIYKSNLDINYRSAEAIVEFNNKIFTKENIENFIKELLNNNKPKKIDFDFNFLQSHIQIYENSKQQIPESKKNKNFGYVRVEKISNKNDNGEKNFKKKEYREIVKEKFILLIKELRNRYNYKDIAVLARENKDVKEIVSWLLELEEIKVESDITVNIKNNPIIQEIIAFLQFLQYPIDNFSFIQFITGKIFNKKFGIEKEEIYKWLNEILIKDNKAFLYKSFQKWQPEIWEKYFEDFFKLVGYMPLYEFVQLFLRKWNIFKNFKKHNFYFLQLLEVIKNKETDLKSFLEYYYNAEDNDEALLIKTQQGLDAIKVMTIHKAKGLEFPVVIVPFAEIYDKTDNTFFHQEGKRLVPYYIKNDYTFFSEKLCGIYYEENFKKIIDELNNYYVAFTRAKNELYIFLNDSTKNRKNRLTKLFSKLLEDKSEYEYGEKFTESFKKYTEKGNFELNLDDLSENLNWTKLVETKVKKAFDISKETSISKEYGNLVHYILSLIEKYPDEKLNEKIEIACKKFNYDSNLIKDKILKILENSEVKKFFTIRENDKVFIEKDIVDREGRLHRIDRFIIREDRIEVLDFKTGVGHKEEHKKQILVYRNLLKSIYPDKKTFCYLIYTDDNKIEVVQ